MREASSAFGSAKVAIISEGPGNVGMGNLYPASVLERDGPAAFEGVKAYLDHSSVEEQENLPERSLEDVVGYYSGVDTQTIDGLVTLVGTLNFLDTPAGRTGKSLAAAALAYNKKYINLELLGVSINADGPSHVEWTEKLLPEYPQFREQLSQRENWNVVDGIERSPFTSVDMVTSPGARGKILSLSESLRRRSLSSKAWRKEFDRVLAEANSQTTLGQVTRKGVMREDNARADLRAQLDNVDAGQPESLAAFETALRAYLDDQESSDDVVWLRDLLDGLDVADEQTVAALLTGARTYLNQDSGKEESMKHSCPSCDCEESRFDDEEEESRRPRRPRDEETEAMFDDPDDDETAQGAAHLDGYSRYSSPALERRAASIGQSAYAARKEASEADGHRRYRVPSEVREKRESMRRLNANIREAISRTRPVCRNANDVVNTLRW